MEYIRPGRPRLKEQPLSEVERTQRYRARLRKLKAVHYRGRGTGENHWFTPTKYIDAVREVMGDIDVDPASHEEAQERIDAAQFFTRKDNGLAKQWHGRIWLNPPYARDEIGPFIDKLGVEIEAGHTTEAILLTHNYSDTAWFHKAVSFTVGACFTLGRVRFISRDGKRSNSTQGQTFFYYGRDWAQFCRVFSEFGALCRWQLGATRQPYEWQDAAQ